MWVPYATAGACESAASIRVFEEVNGSTTLVGVLKVTSASRSFGFLRAANARAAAIADLIGFPAMLSLASTTTTAPKVVPPAALAGTSVTSTTDFPFSKTRTLSAESERLVGRLRTNARSGNFAPPASVTWRFGRPAAADAARGRRAAARQTEATTR